jgi:hypothetical protein
VTRGYRPVVAIGEAQQAAMDRGCLVISVSSPASLPFDFIISDRGRISLVRVRRLRYPRYETADISRSCRKEILRLRSLRLPEEYSRELHVRGPSRHWHRYRINEDSLEELEKENSIADSETAKGWGNHTLSRFSRADLPVSRNPAMNDQTS